MQLLRLAMHKQWVNAEIRGQRNAEPGLFSVETPDRDVRTYRATAATCQSTFLDAARRDLGIATHEWPD